MLKKHFIKSGWPYQRRLFTLLCATGFIGFLTTPIIANAAVAAAKPTGSSTTNLIIDHDGAFEDYYAILVAALSSKQSNAKIKLIGITTSPTGESYCPGTNRYPNGTPGINPADDVNVVGNDRSIDALTQKVLSIAGYKDAPIFSGCGESTGNVNVDNITFKVELPLGGLSALGPCKIHKELVFSPLNLQCFSEFPKRFRDESLLFVDPVAIQTLQENKIKQLSLINGSMKASDYLAKKICEAKSSNKLILATVGPMTNLGRALEKIEANPGKYGCSADANERKAQWASALKVVHMAGSIDPNPEDNWDSEGKYKLRGNTITDLDGNVITQNDYPTETYGNIYWDPLTFSPTFPGFHVFGGHQNPWGAVVGITANLNKGTRTCFEEQGYCIVDNNTGPFNALNNAEFNMFADSVAADKTIKSGLPSELVGVNATQWVPLAGFRESLKTKIENGSCTTPAAKFVYGVQSINTPDGSFFGYDTLYFWDTLAITSAYNDFVNFEDKNIKVTTPTSGEIHTDKNPANGSGDNSKIWKVDVGKMYEVADGSPVKVGMGVIGNQSAFKQTFQDYVTGVLCSQK